MTVSTKNYVLMSVPIIGQKLFDKICTGLGEPQVLNKNNGVSMA